MPRTPNPTLFQANLPPAEFAYWTDLTLLDVHAAAIAQGWCSAMGRRMEAEDTDTGWRERFSRDVYDLAQAMLDERARRANGGQP